MRLSYHSLLAAAAAVSLGCYGASAKVTPEEAAKLKTTLTPLGAERAGNSAGTIPAWTGGITSLPAGVNPNAKLPDFYAGDAKLLTIDASNVDKYADKLAPGTIWLLKHYAGYKVNVYPTHRPEAAPQWFYDATFANATTAELKNENWVINAKGGVPFPIPKTGKEAVWNLNLTWYGVNTFARTSGFIVAPNGTPLLNAITFDQRARPYADMNVTSGPFLQYYLTAVESTVGPPNRVGNAILAWNTFNQDAVPQITWQYLVGQRRLRKAPQVTYDGAYPDCGGIMSVDELALFNGAPDRYNIQLLGKKEMYVPYDDNGMDVVPAADLLKPNYLNPDHTRWELHRIWTLDFTLAPGKRHLLPHRRVYLDEDTWQGTTSEDYDSSGTLARIGQAFPHEVPMFPGTFAASNVFYDTRGAGYCIVNAVTGDDPKARMILPKVPGYPQSFFSPSTVAAESSY
ncbi:MAG: DUF1329 domain-containing protein [Janthinobacterium lividum]